MGLLICKKNHNLNNDKGKCLYGAAGIGENSDEKLPHKIKFNNKIN